MTEWTRLISYLSYGLSVNKCYMSEVDQAIMGIIKMKQASDVELKQNCKKEKDKIESERKQAEDVRKK